MKRVRAATTVNLWATALLAGLLATHLLMAPHALADDDEGPTLKLGAPVLSFDGENDFINVGGARSLNPTTAVTLEAWVKPDLEANDRNAVFRKEFDGYDTGTGHSQSNVFFLAVRPDGIRFRVGRGQVRDGDPADGEWTHIAATYDGEEMRVYQDGELVGSRSHSEPINVSDHPVYLGVRGHGDNEIRDFSLFHGEMAEARIWNVARSASEIEQDMNRVLTGSEEGLIGYWRLNEGRGDRVHDATAANHGRIQGDAAWTVSTQRPISDTVGAGATESIAIQAQDADGEPITAGELEDIVSVTGGRIDPATVTIGEGESTASFTWQLDEPGEFTLTAEHDDFAADSHAITVTGAERLVISPGSEVLARGRAADLSVRVEDADGRPVTAGEYTDLISVNDGRLFPGQVDIAEGEAIAHFGFSHHSSGQITLTAEHDDLPGDTRDLRVGILAALNDDDPAVQTAAVDALRQIGAERFLGKLEEDEYGRAFSPLMALLASADRDSVTWHGAFDAAEAILNRLSRRSDEDSLAVIRQALQDAPSGDLRQVAARALGGNADAVDALRDALGDEDWRVRTEARWALQAMGEDATAELADGASDWPTWRYESGRGAATPHALADELHLNWVRHMPEPRRAWPPQQDDFDKLEYDLSYEPIVAGELMFVGSMTDDTVTAYDITTGEQQWRYHTGGPVRVAPAFADGRLYVPSDDGFLHCLDAESGEVVWRFEARPAQRQVLGNERITSMWSIRGGPVIEDNIIYFAAGMWPHEGVYIYALDAPTGEIEWVNSGTGSRMDLHQHGGAYAFGGVAPQGAFVVSGDRLIVPGGRTTPAVFDRHTGELLHFRHDTSTTGKASGGYRVYASGDYYFNPRVFTNRVYSLETGDALGTLDADIVLNGAFFSVDSDGRVTQHEPDDSGDRVWRSGEIEGLEQLHVLAGQRLYGSGDDGRIFALQLGDQDSPEAELAWEGEVDGDVFRMLAARDRLFVVTEQGSIYSFGPDAADTLVHDHEPTSIESAGDAWADRAASLLADTDADAGYALMFGVGSGRLLEELIAQSELHIVAYEPDAEKVQQLREQFTDAGVYGSRVAVHEGDALTMSPQLPPYIASLIVSEDVDAAGFEGGDAGETFVRALFRPLRPYGGAVYLPLPEDQQQAFADAVASAELQQAELATADEHVLLTRPGPLPGSDIWTHQYADAANTTYSDDSLVRAPLGITWFGGPSNNKHLPRHMNGPIPHVVEGRQIILGVNHLIARCAYTGRTLWEAELPLVGANFTSFDHEEQMARGDRTVYFPNHPGANFIGSPYVSTTDSVYLIYEDQCLRFDLETGEQIAAFDIPDRDVLLDQLAESSPNGETRSYASQITEGDEKRWGTIRVHGDYLIVAAYPHMFDDSQPGREDNWNATSSDYVLAMDRRSGDIQWVHLARYGFRHNAIAAANDRVFAMDNLSSEIVDQLERRGIEPDVDSAIRAIDLTSGEVVWSYDDEVFGTWLSYSTEHDVLVQAGRRGARRPLSDEPRDRMVALRGSDGEPLWDRSERHTGPIALHDYQQRVIAGQNERSLDLLTGETHEPAHPISGVPEQWRFNRTYGCGTQNVSRNLITFRSGAAGYYDLHNESGVGNIAGFRSGCTNNMVAADGMLNAPEYTRSCSCSYQHQTSVGMAYTPDTEMWTYNTYSDPDPGTIRRVGVNFGAPGSRVLDDGTMWVNYPNVRRVPTPELPLSLEADDAEYFGKHAMQISDPGEGYRWVAASGVENVTGLHLEGLYNDEGSTYTVRLHFAEPHAIEAGDRVFDITLQGETVVENFDLVAETGGHDLGYVAEFNGVSLGDDGDIRITFVPRSGDRTPVIAGLEIALED